MGFKAFGLGNADGKARRCARRLVSLVAHACCTSLRRVDNRLSTRISPSGVSDSDSPWCCETLGPRRAGEHTRSQYMNCASHAVEVAATHGSTDSRCYAATAVIVDTLISHRCSRVLHLRRNHSATPPPRPFGPGRSDHTPMAVLAQPRIMANNSGAASEATPSVQANGSHNQRSTSLCAAASTIVGLSHTWLRARVVSTPMPECPPDHGHHHLVIRNGFTVPSFLVAPRADTAARRGRTSWRDGSG
jgi:hypothetical protein